MPFRLRYLGRQRWFILRLFVSTIFMTFVIYHSFWKLKPPSFYELHYVALLTAEKTERFNQSELRYLTTPAECNSSIPVFIKCHISDVESRRAIRRTWKEEALKLGMLVIFSVGFLLANATSILQESSQYGDILQADFEESYHHLTLKTYANMYWFTKQCSNAEYAIFLDTDVLFYPKNLVAYLSEKKNRVSQNTIIGCCHYHVSNVVRDTASKWFMPREIWPLDLYPPYCQGNGYFMTGDVPKKLLEAIPGGKRNWAWAKRLDHLEDVIFTGLLTTLSNVTRKYTNLMKLENKTISSALCYGLISAHSFGPPTEYVTIWSNYRLHMNQC